MFPSVFDGSGGKYAVVDGGASKSGGDAVDESEFFKDFSSAQRQNVATLVRKHAGASMAIPAVSPPKRLTPEKMFRVDTLIEWESGDPEVVVDVLRKGRTRARLSARMGLGKSVKLGPYIAKTMQYSVLIVGLDAIALGDNGDYMSNTGLAQITRTWGPKGAESVSVMTYGDFTSFIASARRDQLFKAFDLIIFDEAFVNTAHVWAAHRMFAAYASADINLLCCSATIRKDGMGGGTSSAAGSFIETPADVTVADAIASRKLVTTYLHDKTLVVVGCDDDVDALVDHYEAEGADARGLWTYSMHSDFADRSSWLAGDSMTPRVLVAVSSYCIGFNLPVAFAVVFPEHCAYAERDGVWKEVRYPMVPEMVKQAQSRTGRGLADSSSGLIMARSRGSAMDLAEDERLLAYVLLCSASIKPLANGSWADCAKYFPDGLDSVTANNLLSVNLPVKLMLKYLGSDGYFAAKYCAGLNLFAHCDVSLLPSEDELPVKFADWVESDLTGYDVRAVKVPVKSEGIMQLILHGISVYAEGGVMVERWRPEEAIAYRDGYDSDETAAVTKKKKAVRRISNVAVELVPEPVTDRSVGFTRTTTRAERRQGVLDYDERFAEALASLRSKMEDFKVTPTALHVTGDSDVEIELPSPTTVGEGVVESPGGSEVCRLPADVGLKLNMGEMLSPKDVVEVTRRAHGISGDLQGLQRFVASKLFDNFAGPWESWLTALGDDHVRTDLIRTGYSTEAFQLVSLLESRLNWELGVVLSTSNVTQGRFRALMGLVPNVDKLFSSIQTGQFSDIAQTKEFFNRVKYLKWLIDVALVRAQKSNIYLPREISAAQRALINNGVDHLGRVDGRRMVVAPRGFGGRIHGRLKGAKELRRPKFGIDF